MIAIGTPYLWEGALAPILPESWRMRKGYTSRMFVPGWTSSALLSTLSSASMAQFACGFASARAKSDIPPHRVSECGKTTSPLRRA